MLFYKKAKVREWPKGVLTIATTLPSSITPSEEIIVNTKSSLKELLSYSLQFPPTFEKFASYIKCCPQCRKLSANMKEKLFKY